MPIQVVVTTVPAVPTPATRLKRDKKVNYAVAKIAMNQRSKRILWDPTKEKI